MTAFRIFLCSCLALCFSASLTAQSWQSTGGNTTTTENVGIGSNNAPSSLLELNAPTVVQTIRYAPANYGSLYFYENASLTGYFQMIGSTYATYPTIRNIMMIGNSVGPEVFYTTTAERMRIDTSGNVGIGTAAPQAKLHVEDLTNSLEVMVSAGDTGTPNSPTLTLMRKDSNHTQLAKYGFKLDASDGNKLKILYGSTAGFTSTALTIDPAGNLLVDGNISAKYQDVAEWVPADGDLAAGTVVVLNRTKSNEVTPSVTAYDTAVAGVVSERPGVLLGQAGKDKVKIATTGRVKVRVDARHHSIQVGDLLVTSDKGGMAMFSEPLDLGGVKIHRPGTLIGKALEPLAGGEGEILVLLSLQ